MRQKKYLFIDRDGTLIKEPSDEQVDSLEKLQFMPEVIMALKTLKQQGYHLVMVTNQDGLGTDSFPEKAFIKPHQFMLDVFTTQGIIFDAIHICPHFVKDNCQCRKPLVGLLMGYLREQSIDREHSYVIGDRDSDMQLADNLGIQGIKFSSTQFPDWNTITNKILSSSRIAKIHRKTKETDIYVRVDLDNSEEVSINTGIGFFDHMLEQFAKHSEISCIIESKGDLHIDEHHSVEDTALALGEALKQALHDKIGIERYGFILPMDESIAQVAIDLSGRAFCQFECDINREKIGDMSTEMIPHFFNSLSQSLQATIHIKAMGENTHHQIEAIFKAFARCFKQAKTITTSALPSTKGVL